MVDFWMITYKSLGNIQQLLDSARKCSLPHTITILDNSVDDKFYSSVQALLQPGERAIQAEENLFACQGSEVLRGVTHEPYICYTCVAHTFVQDPSWVNESVTALENDPHGAMAGCLARYPGLFYFQAMCSNNAEKKWNFPDPMPLLQGKFSRQEIVELADTLGHIQGGLWVIKRKALDECGGFDTAFTHLFMDVELSARFQCYGWNLIDIPTVKSESNSEQAIKNPKQYKAVHTYHGVG